MSGYPSLRLLACALMLVGVLPACGSKAPEERIAVIIAGTEDDGARFLTKADDLGLLVSKDADQVADEVESNRTLVDDAIDGLHSVVDDLSAAEPEVIIKDAICSKFIDWMETGEEPTWEGFLDALASAGLSQSDFISGALQAHELVDLLASSSSQQETTLRLLIMKYRYCEPFAAS